MKTIIAGSRTFDDYEFLKKVCQEEIITEIVSGNANGADKLGEKFAKEHQIHLTKFVANWDEFGKRAGYLRNNEMADYAEQLIAFNVNNSKGTEHMIKIAKEKGLRVVAYNIS